MITDHEISIQEFSLAVYRYCVRTRGSVTSWVRTPGRNIAVGGVPGSFHMRGLGADVVLDDASHLPVDTDARHRLANSLGLRLVIESDHDHLELKT